MNQATSPTFSAEETYHAFLTGLLAGNRQQCQASFERWLEATPDVRSVYEDLVQRALYEVGEKWEQGKISVATEHAATAICESLLNLTYPRLFAQPRRARSVVVTCVVNEYHQIGAKMVADLFEWHGWRGYFLGANTPIRDVCAFIADKRPDAVAFSVATAFALDRLANAVTEIRTAFPEIPVLVGGQALRGCDPAALERLPEVHTMTSLSQLETWIKKGESDV